jgi:hypothetical protein
LSCSDLSTLFGKLEIAIRKAEAPITHVMKNEVSANRGPGGLPGSFGREAIHVSGPQTKNANRASMAVSIMAAARGKIENSIASLQAICAKPVR